MARRTFAYECRFCGKLFNRYNIAIRHEHSCTKNPESINCLSCKYCDTDYKVKLKNGKIINQPHCIKNDLRCSKSVSGNCKDFESKE